MAGSRGQRIQPREHLGGHIVDQLHRALESIRNELLGFSGSPGSVTAYILARASLPANRRRTATVPTPQARTVNNLVSAAASSARKADSTLSRTCPSNFSWPFGAVPPWSSFFRVHHHHKPGDGPQRPRSHRGGDPSGRDTYPARSWSCSFLSTPPKRSNRIHEVSSKGRPKVSKTLRHDVLLCLTFHG